MDEMYIGVLRTCHTPETTVFGRHYPSGVPRLESLRKATRWERLLFRIKHRLGLVPKPGTIPRDVRADNVSMVIMADAPVIEKLYGISVGCMLRVAPPIRQAEQERCEI